MYQPIGSQNVGITSCVNFDGNTNVNITTNVDAKGRMINNDAGSGNTLSFHDIHYTVQYKEGIFKKAEKTILKGISGVFKPGLNAIMGPTGSGKTTLLDILAARKDISGLTGRVLINGKPLPSDFRHISGYVVENDVAMATLTVRENLTFSAALRLPSSVNKKEREQRVHDVIQELGLQDCADTKIGNEYIRGVSGGEKKRTCVGMELIIKPGILFLDEPTTGLDASTAVSIMRSLEELTRGGHTIIFSIHQPRYQIYRLFDTLHLLSRGETVYHGATTDVLEFFKDNGYVRQEQDNPADFLLDSIHQNQAGAARIPNTTKAGAAGGGSSILNGVNIHDTEEMEPCQPQVLLSECFKKSDYYSHVATEADAMYEKFKFEEATKQTYNYRTSVFTQFRHIGKRAFLNVIRNPRTTIQQAVTAIVFSIIMGTLYFQIGGAPANAIQDRVGALFLIVMQGNFFNMNTLETFIAERFIFLHESRSGFYRTSAFFLGKLFCDLLPLRAVIIFLYATVSYWIIGFKTEFMAYLIFTGNLVVTAWSTAALFVLIGTFGDNIFDVLPIIGLTNIIMVLFGGFLININSPVPWLAWLKWFSIVRYSYNTVLANELSGQVFCNPFPDNSTCEFGDVYLGQQGIDSSARSMWMNEIALIYERYENDGALATAKNDENIPQFSYVSYGYDKSDNPWQANDDR
ncbi:broad substrate specificity ATP-binding cassette transporter ABCG2-like [Amphiura filiformis]|uniref:broad substrate specificity ATP-binding cassette transporter ABCG2-like n=1 Tax=Amphiura filiformis TaxID=82378 RepID=UPI003B21E8B4